ncbi:Uncharacterised protein [Mycobacteroides abscessus subsp. abscessus]|nr:Uncharacterised protein [Mycobacteroides abscessus subsp. abscessus]
MLSPAALVVTAIEPLGSVSTGMPVLRSMVTRSMLAVSRPVSPCRSVRRSV